MSWDLQHSYLKLPAHFYQRVLPASVSKPQLILFNSELAQELGLMDSALSEQDLANFFSGNELHPNMNPIAQAYAGHQFGHFTMLGDGRAILLGEIPTNSGILFDLQLKGAGPTPYSRRGDGRAALGPMLREFLISESMHAMNIPSTRSLAVVSTGDSIFRESELPGAILTRIAQSHIRVGTFQFAAGANQGIGLQALADYAIQRHDPEILGNPNRYLQFLHQVMDRQAKLISRWMGVGFIHGVMNTDNMTISGETIDYGPCAFMDHYDPRTVFSSIDHHGRYAYENQPPIAQWNLARFAETLLPLLDPDREKAVKIAETVIREFPALYSSYWMDEMRRKLGLTLSEKEDQELVMGLLNWMEKTKADYTLTFRELTFFNDSEEKSLIDPEFQNWKKDWKNRLSREKKSVEEIRMQMKKNNPCIIPRNHQVEEALSKATQEQNLSPFLELLKACQRPFEESESNSRFRTPPPSNAPPYRTFCGT